MTVEEEDKLDEEDHEGQTRQFRAGRNAPRS